MQIDEKEIKFTRDLNNLQDDLQRKIYNLDNNVESLSKSLVVKIEELEE